MAASFDYAAREFVLILEEMRANIRRKLPDVNDFFESNEGRYLLDQWAGVADMLGFTIDRSMLECFLSTVETRANLVDLLRLIGFQPQNPTPERVVARFNRGSNTDAELVIPKYTTVISNSGIPFVTEAAVTFPPGQSEVLVGCIQGRWVDLPYVSSGAPNQMVTLSSPNIADGMVRVAVESVDWTRATDNTFVGHSPDDTVFKIVHLGNKRVRVEFGNGAEGTIPPRGSKVTVSSFVTQGVNGHIDSNSLAAVEYNGASVIPSNDEPSAGGNDYETAASAKRRYPAAFKAMRRAVSLGDWEALAALVPGVMQAKAVDLNLDRKLPFFKVRLHVIGHSGLVSDALNTTVKEFLRTRRVNATLFEVVSPTRVFTDVTAEIYVKRSFNPEEVQSSVTSVVQDFFRMTADADSEVKLGENVALSRLTAVMQEVPGVSYLNLKSPVGAFITVKPNEFVALRSATITVAGLV